MGKSTVAVVAVVLCSLGYTVYFLERKAELRLPAPSFKAVGPGLTPRLPAKGEGHFAPNDALHKANLLFQGNMSGSESVAVGPDGYLYMLDKFGIVYKAKPGRDSQLERITHLGPGRPLGFHFDAAGDIIICNAGTGLQKLELKTKQVILLASEAPSSINGSVMPIRYANDLAIANDGAIYFTDSTNVPPAFNAAGFYDTMTTFLLDLFQGEGSGRLLRYNPATQETSLIADGFWYANGVALAEDESYALVVETCMLRVVQVWLKGPKAGQRDVFFDLTPGYPDGVSSGSGNTFWVAVVSPRQPILEIAMRSRFLRWLVPNLPASVKKPPSKAGMLLKVSAEGKVLQYLADADGSHVSTLSAATETPEGLYFGNLGGDSVSFLSKSNIPSLKPASERTEL